MASKDYVTGTTNKILIGAATAVGLIVTGVVGVSVFTPAYQVRDSSGQLKWQVNLAGQSTQSGVIASKTLANCDTIDGTSTGMLVCGTDDGGSPGGGGAWSGTGALQTYFDPRYVNTSGDTMTGKLLINLTSGTDALEVVQTVSGNIIHAQTELHSSGSLTVEGTTTLNGAVTIGAGNLSNDSILEPDLSADNAALDGDILTYDSTGTNFAWITPNAGTDVTADLEEETHATEHNEGGADALTVESLASSCTDGQVIGGNGTGGAECQADVDTNTTYTAAQGITLAGTAFSLSQAHSGTVIKAVTSLASSGSLIFEGAASGSSLFLGTSLQGAGLTDCDVALTSKLLWDATTGRFVCGSDSDTNTTYTAGQGLTLTSTSFKTNDTLTGTMLRFLTISGALVRAKNTIASSGSLVWETAASGATLTVSGQFDGVGLSDCDADNQSLSWDSTTKRFVCGDDDDTNTTYTASQGLTLNGTSFNLTPSHSGTTIWATTALRSSGALTWEGSGSGASLYIGDDFEGAGLTDCDADGQTLAWDATSKRFSCGDDDDTNTTYTAGQGLSLLSTSFKINGTVTGSLVSFQTVSGALVRSNVTLASSGTLVFEGAGSGSSLFLGTSLKGAGLVDCDVAGSSKLLWDATTGRFSCGTDQDTGTISAGEGLEKNGTVVSRIATVTGTSLEIYGTASGRILHAQDQLRSSGALVWEGAGSGASLYIGNDFKGAGLSDCDADGQTLGWDSTTGRFTCGDDDTGGSPLVAGEGLQIIGSTISRISTVTGTSLAIYGTASGYIVHANTQLRSSGSLAVENAAVIGGNLTAGDFICSSAGCIGAAELGTDSVSADELNAAGVEAELEAVLDHDDLQGFVANEHIDWTLASQGTIHATNYVDNNTTYTAGQGLALNGTVFVLSGTITGSLLEFLTVSGSIVHANSQLRSSGSLVWEGQGSGSSLYIGGAFDGVGLVDCDADNQTLSWDATTKRFGCGDDDSGGSGLSYQNAEGIFVNQGGDTMTGALIINLSSGIVGLEVIQTASASILHANTLLRSSGSLAIDGGFFQDNLADCDNAGEKPIYNITTGKWTCGTDDDVPESGDFAAAADLDADGSITDGVIDKADLSVGTDFGEVSTDGSSNITIDADVIGQNEVSDDSLDFAELQDALDVDANTTVTLGANNLTYVIGSTGQLEFVGVASGVTLHAQTLLRSSGSLLVDGSIYFNALNCQDTEANGGVLTVGSDGLLKCEDDNATGSGLDQSAADARYVNLSGDTMTGALAITVTGGNDATIALEVPHTISGTIIRANSQLFSSGSLAVETTGIFGSTVTASDFICTDCLDFAELEDILDLDATTKINLGANTLQINFDSTGDFTFLNQDNPIHIFYDDGKVEWNVSGLSTADFIVYGEFAGDALVVDSSTENTGVGTRTPQTKLEVIGTMSGDALYATRAFSGAGLVDCDTPSTSKLLWNVSTSKFSCGTDTDTNTTYTAGGGLTLNGTSFSLNSTVTGSTLEFSTVSGASVISLTAVSPMHLQVQLFNTGSSLKTGSGWAMPVIPPTASGFNVVAAYADVNTAGTTNTTNIHVSNRNKGNRKIFSTPVSIDSGETSSITGATPFVVNTSNDDVSGGDRLFIDISTISATPPKGLTVTVVLRKP